MVSVKVVERPVDEVVEVVAVRDARVPTAGVVLRGALDGGAGVRAAAIDLEDVLLDAGAAGRVEVPVVEIIGVIAMADDLVTAARPVLVGMTVPLLHGVAPSSRGSIVLSGAPGQGRSGRA